MENNNSFSYPNSQASTPRSLPVDVDADDTAAGAGGGGGGGHKVKFICSYGGQIQPRAHDNRLSYVGGDAKILAIERTVRFPALLARLAAVSGAADEFSVKYQLPGEDLDALISVTNDEDLDHLMAEYDRLSRASPKPARMRLFLFPASPPAARPDSKWLVDALNAAPIQAAMESATAEVGDGRDFLFGLDKGYPPPPPPPAALTTAAAAETVSPAEVGTPVRSDSGTPPPPPEIERQIEEMKRMQIGGGHEYYAQQPRPAIASADPRSVYLVHPRAPPPARVYSGVQPVASQIGQGYYVVQQPPPPPEIYHRESAAAMYGMPTVGPAKIAYAAEGGGANMVRAAVPDLVYGQIAYDSAGRPFYFASSAPGTAMVAPGGVAGAYTTVPASAVEVRPPAVEVKLGKSAAQAS